MSKNILIVPDKDPGDETQRNFRYQHEIGVMILIDSYTGIHNYVSLICEQHEDFICEIKENYYDAYQIKTSTPENGPWKMTSEALLKSLKRFFHLESFFPENFCHYIFYSNTDFLNSSTDDKINNSPMKFLTFIQNLAAGSQIKDIFKKRLGILENQIIGKTEKTPHQQEVLLNMLKKVKLTKGPSRENIDSEIAHYHLTNIDLCASFRKQQLDMIRENLIHKVSQASALYCDDTRKNWLNKLAMEKNDPYLENKRITISDFRNMITEYKDSRFRYLTQAKLLNLSNDRQDKNVLVKKLKRAGLMSQIDSMENLAISTEQFLLEKLHTDENFKSTYKHLIGIVKNECDESMLFHESNPIPFGKEMMRDMIKRLKQIVESNDLLKRERIEYEVLKGVSALLTDDCKVWWGPEFNIDE